jgi:hypothetical protein
MIRWRDCARNRDRQRQQERVLSTPSHFVFIDQDAEIGTGIRKLLLNKTCGIDGSRRSGARTAALLVLLHRLCRHLSLLGLIVLGRRAILFPGHLDALLFVVGVIRHVALLKK